MPHLGPVGELDDLLNQGFSAVVGRVRLARDDQLDRPVLVEQQLLQPLGVTQHQRQPLVGRHPAGEPDRQHVRVESRRDPTQFGLWRAALQPRSAQPRTHVLDEQGPQLRPDPPQVTAVDLVDPQPDTGVGERVRTDQFLAQRQPLGSRPGRACTPFVIDPIGTSSVSKPVHSSLNISRLTLPCSSDTPLARCGKSQTHVGHVEFLRVVLGAQREDPADRNTGQQHRSGGDARGVGRAAGEVALHHLHREPVDAGRHRGVGGEYGARSHHGQRGVEIQTGVDEFADPLGAKESRVALVHVEYLGRGQTLDRGVGADGPHATDAGEDLLLASGALGRRRTGGR